MVKDFMKNIIVFMIALVICVGSLLAVCKIPQSVIYDNSRVASEYFTENAGFPVLLDGHANTRVDNYADCVLFNVIYNVDSEKPLYSIVAAPYYRIENNDARKDYASAVIDGSEPNNEYSRYWHGSQVLIRPLLMVSSVEGIRLILFSFLILLNAVLAMILIRQKQYVSAAIYFAALILVQFWMTAFTIEYIMSFLVMTVVCIAVTTICSKSTSDKRTNIENVIWNKRITYVFIISGMVTCFLDFLTTETLTFTVPFIIFLMLDRQRNPDRSFNKRLKDLFKWGSAWLLSYAAMFAIKWGLVYVVLGKAAFINALENAAYRIEGAVVTEGAGEAVVEAGTAGQRILVGLLRNVASLLPASDQLSPGAIIGIAVGIIVVLGAILYLFRGEKLDGAFVGILLIVALIPYLRYICLSNHAYIHYFFTYRAQMAMIMAIEAIMIYNLKPSYILSKKTVSEKTLKQRTATAKNKKKKKH